MILYTKSLAFEHAFRPNPKIDLFYLSLKFIYFERINS